MPSYLIKILLTILLFFYIYNPPLKFLPVNSGIIVCIVFFFIYASGLFLKLSSGKKIAVSKRLLTLFLLILLLVLYSFFATWSNNSPDYQLSKNYLSFLLFYIPGAFGITMLLKKNFTLSQAIKIFIAVTILQSIIMIAMLINFDIRDLIFSLLRDTDDRILQNKISGGFRFLGFTFGATWDLSIIQSVGLMLMALLIKTGNIKINIFTAFLFVLILVSVLLAGRTGILGVFLALLILITPVRFSEIPFYKFVKFVAIISVLVIPLLVIIKRNIPAPIMDAIEMKFLPWATEMFNSDNGKLLETSSSNELKTMYFLPAAKTFFIGDGYYKNPTDPTMYYMNTDGGYMRHLLFYGIGGLLLLVSLYLVIFYQMYHYANLISPSLPFKIFVVLVAVYFFVSHIKGDLLAGADMPLKMLFFLYSLLFCFTTKLKTITKSII